MPSTSSSSPDLLAGYFSEKALATEIRKSLRRLREWRRLGIGPAATWVGRTPYYRIESVQSWLISREKKPPRAGHGMSSRAGSTLSAQIGLALMELKKS